MIRPRAGNFIYQFDEVKKMEQQIDLCKELDIPEIVIGALTNSANVDIQLTKRLASRAYPMNVTFHKAIDYTEDLFFELNRLSKVDNISSILTSGGEETALKGASMLSKMITKFGEKFNECLYVTKQIMMPRESLLSGICWRAGRSYPWYHQVGQGWIQ